MNNQKKILFWIKFPYWVGVVVDAIWAVALLVPSFYGILTQNPEFNPDFETKIVMGIGGSLMTGWTFLLAWAVIDPINRRAVGLLTAFPVISGLFIVTILGNTEGSTSNTWVYFKLSILFLLFITSYILAGKENKKS